MLSREGPSPMALLARELPAASLSCRESLRVGEAICGRLAVSIPSCFAQPPRFSYLSFPRKSAIRSILIISSLLVYSSLPSKK